MKQDFNIREKVREDLRDMVPYDTHPYPNVIRMDLNENPYPFPASIMDEVTGKLKGDVFTRYPDPGAVKLREALAQYNDVQPENIIVGNGSDEIIQLLYLAFGGAGRSVLVPVPTFSMFKINGRISGTQVIELPTDEQFNVSVDELIQTAEECKPNIIILVTPNNPTGKVIPQNDIIKVLEKSESLVVVDEAYFEFNQETVVHYLKEFPNLIVLRTFSKAFGLAGLRVGYLIANEPVIHELNKIKPPFNVNSFSQIAALTALKYKDLFAEQIKMIIKERDRVYEALEEMSGVAAIPSQSNYILFKTPLKSEKVYNKLLDEGILIRDLGRAPGLIDYLRVTIGKREENDLFLKKMACILENS